LFVKFFVLLNHFNQKKAIPFESGSFAHLICHLKSVKSILTDPVDQFNSVWNKIATEKIVAFSAREMNVVLIESGFWKIAC
tara:strand:+ start:4089 stop:4331 length:243 start_codon:yes stop_codon:yes gene_type:complete